MAEQRIEVLLLEIAREVARVKATTTSTGMFYQTPKEIKSFWSGKVVGEKFLLDRIGNGWVLPHQMPVFYFYGRDADHRGDYESSLAIFDSLSVHTGSGSVGQIELGWRFMLVERAADGSDRWVWDQRQPHFGEDPLEILERLRKALEQM